MAAVSRFLRGLWHAYNGVLTRGVIEGEGWKGLQTPQGFTILVFSL